MAQKKLYFPCQECGCNCLLRSDYRCSCGQPCYTSRERRLISLMEDFAKENLQQTIFECYNGLKTKEAEAEIQRSIAMPEDDVCDLSYEPQVPDGGF